MNLMTTMNFDDNNVVETFPDCSKTARLHIMFDLAILIMYYLIIICVLLLGIDDGQFTLFCCVCELLYTKRRRCNIYVKLKVSYTLDIQYG